MNIRIFLYFKILFYYSVKYKIINNYKLYFYNNKLIFLWYKNKYLFLQIKILSDYYLFIIYKYLSIK